MLRISGWLKSLLALALLLSSLHSETCARADAADAKIYLPVVLLGYAPPSPLKSIATGQWHTCALTSAGAVKCWGWNSDGQLGNGNTDNSPTPVVAIASTTPVSAITAGAQHTCALTVAGGVKCWGDNNRGQLGDDSTTEHHTPTNVVGLTSGVKAIAAGDYYTCALTTAGGVKCWGWNDGGELGDATTIDRHVPTDVYGLTSGAQAIAAGGDHACAVNADGGLMCWGHNEYGQLGNGANQSSSFPVHVSGLDSGVSAIAAGSHHTCALTTTGLKCWGAGLLGQIGNGGTGDSHTPKDVIGMASGVATFAAGYTHSCAVITGGALQCWGSDMKGELGNNVSGSGQYRSYPVDAQGLSSGILAVAGGNAFTCALTADGGAKCWGWNNYGQVGDGSTTDRHAPVDVVGFP